MSKLKFLILTKTLLKCLIKASKTIKLVNLMSLSSALTLTIFSQFFLSKTNIIIFFIKFTLVILFLIECLKPNLY